MRACDAAIVSTSTLARRWQELKLDQLVQVLAKLVPPELCVRFGRLSKLGAGQGWWLLAPRRLTSRFGLRNWLQRLP